MAKRLINSDKEENDEIQRILDKLYLPDSYEKYKIDESAETLETVIDKIRYCLDNYESTIKEYESYRQKIREEKEKFEEDIRKVFFENRSI